VKRSRGFTLIELLVVIAIILILIAIALPNFLSAQVRAKVTLVKGDMRTVAVALEEYYTDWNKYLNRFYPAFGPPVGSNVAKAPGGGWLVLVNSNGGRSGFGGQLTTPIKYITDIPGDPFWQSTLQDDYGSSFTFCSTLYWGTREIYPTTSFGPPPYQQKPLRYVLQSCGPDLQQDGFQPGYGVTGLNGYAQWYVYSPTNGVASNGEILYYPQFGFLDQSGR
jgi:prepilin-type N-terminal cleavage/methylation domain-containing protein